jgi:tetratricopeptide (TPR) repeat protein
VFITFFLLKDQITFLNKNNLTKSPTTSAEDFPNNNIHFNKAINDYQKIQKLVSRFEYDKILVLPWNTIDILYQNNKTNDAIQYGYIKCNALFMVGKEKDALNALKNIINKFEGKTKDCAFNEILMLKAIIYQRLNYYKLALVSLEKASLFVQNNTECADVRVSIETEKSYLFTTLNQHDKSLVAAKNALRFSKKKQHIAGSYGVIGKVFLSLNQPKKAYVNISKALKLVDKNDTYRVNYYKCLLIEAYFRLDNHRKLDSLFLELKSDFWNTISICFIDIKLKVWSKEINIRKLYFILIKRNNKFPKCI